LKLDGGARNSSLGEHARCCATRAKNTDQNVDGADRPTSGVRAAFGLGERRDEVRARRCPYIGQGLANGTDLGS
jgi:hypothetical protein